MNWMRRALVLISLLAPIEARAIVYYSNYLPSDTAVTVKEHFLPLDYRSPEASQSFTGGADVGAFCANFACSGFVFTSVTTEFVASSSFAAKSLVVPVNVISSFGNFRIGFSFSRFNSATSKWEGLGGTQIESGLLPRNSTNEVELPFGESGARFIDYRYEPIQFVAGERYQLLARYGTGAAGGIRWYFSDEAADPGEAVRYGAGHPASLANPVNLAFKPAFALTDGGDLSVIASVPEPDQWAMLIVGTGLIGWALRRAQPAAGIALG